MANVGVASVVFGAIAASILGASAHFVTVTFLVAFVVALFVGTTIVPLVPPRLEIR